MINVSKPILDEQEIVEVNRVLRSGMLVQGPEVAKFEAEFAEFIGVKHAIATSNGSTALLVALMAMKEQQKETGSFLQKTRQKIPLLEEEVITTPFTFLASASSIVLAGYKPVFVDIDPYTFCIDPYKLEKAITWKTVAIMPVHLYGNACNMDVIRAIAKKHNLRIIEDCAQSIGTEFKGSKAGSMGDVGCFSFYPSKNMTTSEGGMCTTNDDALADKCRLIRAHGMRKLYQYEWLGFNYRLTDIQAAIGRVQLRKLPGFNNSRNYNADYYNVAFKQFDPSEKWMVTPSKVENVPMRELLSKMRLKDDDVYHTYHQYTIMVKSHRNELQQFLKENGVNTGIYYPAPLYEFPIMSKYRPSEPCFATNQVVEQVLSLPIHPDLKDEELKIVTDLIIQFAQTRGLV